MFPKWSYYFGLSGQAAQQLRLPLLGWGRRLFLVARCGMSGEGMNSPAGLPVLPLAGEADCETHEARALIVWSPSCIRVLARRWRNGAAAGQ